MNLRHPLPGQTTIWSLLVSMMDNGIHCQDAGFALTTESAEYLVPLSQLVRIAGVGAGSYVH
ncbi:MAG TPA: hypothetical protein VMF03_20780 [Steroidobacteraceae bacterium]|nr:hypothetical protein [Steroidobacteraceae bacterium]